MGAQGGSRQRVFWDPKLVTIEAVDEAFFPGQCFGRPGGVFQTLTWIVPVVHLYQVTRVRRTIQSNLSGHLRRLASRVETSYSKDLAITFEFRLIANHVCHIAEKI